MALQHEIEKVQNRAARFVASNYSFETGSMTGILEYLKWESHPPPPPPAPAPIRRSRNHHSLPFQTLATRTDIYKDTFFPQTIRDWNTLPDSIITSAERAEDGVARFTSLVRARD